MSGGLFVVVEGPDGVGKSTLAIALAARFGARSNPLLTREPSDGLVGRKIRRVLRGAKASKLSLSPIELAELYAQDRIEHLAAEILPALRADRVVICDRYVLSSIAYQHGAQGVPLAEVRRLNRYAVRADATIVLSALETTCSERRRARGGKGDALESADIQRAVRRVYAYADVLIPDHSPIEIDAGVHPDVVLAKAIDALSRATGRI